MALKIINMQHKHFSVKERIKSFGYAFCGLKIFLREEHNARIHLTVAICTVAAGFLFKISAIEWVAIAFAIGIVVAFEIVNTAIEHIANFVSPEYNDKIKIIKDLTAGGVFVSALTAFAVGCIVFTPKIIDICLKS